MSIFDKDAKVEEASEAEQLTGKLASQNEEQKLMHLVMENDKEIIQRAIELFNSTSKKPLADWRLPRKKKL